METIAMTASAAMKAKRCAEEGNMAEIWVCKLKRSLFGLLKDKTSKIYLKETMKRKKEEKQALRLGQTSRGPKRMSDIIMISDQSWYGFISGK